MPFKFESLLTPEQRAKVEHAKQKTAEFKALPLAKLNEMLAIYYKNAAGPRWGDGTKMLAGDQCYDATLHHILLPEVMERLVALDATLAKIRAIAEEQLAEESIGDVKYVMRELDEILELAGGKKTNAW